MLNEPPDGGDMSSQPDEKKPITVEVREEHIYRCDPDSTVN